MCCGTKRLVQIECPNDCPYLTTAREHPAAAVVRKQQRDFDLVVHTMRDLNERQSQLFFLVATFLIRYESPEWQRLSDEDVAEGAAALAGTFETAARGVIYEHRPASIPAGRLAAAMKQALGEAASSTTSAFERDAAVVLRRVEEAARAARGADPTNPRAFIDLLARLVTPPAVEGGSQPAEASRLIVP